ncbi:MAG: carboxypeptidase-like regulatory domain-containing protein [Bryobacterales bacterium]|nr:carboxypeptidase-like regulatory domain-containing protein [Bryobacterales bacterium]
MRTAIRTCILAVAGATALFGQVDAGTIAGTVRDSTGAVIAGATVIVESVGTGLRIETSTGAQGIYVSPPLRPGEFTVEVRSDGFEPAAKRFQLEVNQRVAVDFELRLGAVTEVIEVLDVAPVLQTESATLSNLRTEKAIKDLPLNGRNWAQLILLSTGTQPADTQSQGSPITRKRGVSNASVNGSRSNDNNYLI